jgi:hypothetical protein
VATLAAEAPRRTGCLPVAVVTTKNTKGPDWPRRAGRLDDHKAQRGTRAVLRSFLREHSYKRTWSNGFFEIWEPQASEPRRCHS